MEMWWGYLLLGLIAGVFGGTLGVGGGIIMVPALVMLFHFPQKSAQGVSLAAMTLLALAATLRYLANPEVRIPFAVVGLISLAAMAGAIIGAELAKRASVRVLQQLFALVMVAAAIKLAFFTKAPKRESKASVAPGAAAAVSGEREPPRRAASTRPKR